MEEEQQVEEVATKFTPEELEIEKSKILKFCNNVFKSAHEKLSSIIIHEYNYEFVFESSNDDRPYIKIISREWFDDKMSDIPHDSKLLA